MNIFNQDYLFAANPGAFGFAGPALFLALLGIGLSFLANWYYKKRRSRYNLELVKRKVAVRHARISIGIFAAYLLFVLFRIAALSVLSMRFFSYLLLLFALLNIVVGVVLTVMAKPVLTGIPEEALRQSEYGKYLPKKKKK
jgi:hypothetical protein